MTTKIENLRKLAEGLLALPKSYKEFTMAYFDSEVGLPKDQPKCGTAACAAGHGPRLGIKAKPEEDWVKYTDRVFTKSSRKFDWCFSPEWGIFDNTPHGAAKRILYMLEHGVPKSFEWPESRWGEVYK